MLGINFASRSHFSEKLSLIPTLFILHYIGPLSRPYAFILAPNSRPHVGWTRTQMPPTHVLGLFRFWSGPESKGQDHRIEAAQRAELFWQVVFVFIILGAFSYSVSGPRLFYTRMPYSKSSRLHAPRILRQKAINLIYFLLPWVCTSDKYIIKPQYTLHRPERPLPFVPLPHIRQYPRLN